MSAQEFDGDFPSDAHDNSVRPEMHDLHSGPHSDWDHSRPVGFDNLAMRDRDYQAYQDIEMGYPYYSGENATFMPSSSAVQYQAWDWQLPSELAEPPTEWANEFSQPEYPHLPSNDLVTETETHFEQAATDLVEIHYGEHGPNAQETEKLLQDIKLAKTWMKNARDLMIETRNTQQDIQKSLKEFQARSWQVRPAQNQGREKVTRQQPQGHKHLKS